MRVFHTLIVILLFVPLVFMGANVFFPDVEYPPYPCIAKPYPSDGAVNESDRIEQAVCERQHQELSKKFETERRQINGWKYVFVVVVSLVALVGALFVPLDASIRFGLFLGSALASFFSTWVYFDSRSIPGFIVLVVIFLVSVFFIQKQWLGKEKKYK